MTELNHNIIKQQMVNILQVAALYNINDETKITYLEVGEPNGNPLPLPPTYPAIWVTNSRPLETIKPSGVITSDSHTILSHDVDYEIKLMVNEEDSIVAEKSLDDFQKILMETLEADVNFKGSNGWLVGTAYVIKDIVSYGGALYQASASTTGDIPPASPWVFLTRLPNDSWPSRVDTFRQNQDGQPVRGRTITWKCKITT